MINSDFMKAKINWYDLPEIKLDEETQERLLDRSLTLFNWKKDLAKL